MKLYLSLLKIFFIGLTVVSVSCSKAKVENHSGHSSGKEYEYIYRPVNRFVISDQKLIRPVIENPDSLLVNGYVAFDPNRNNKIAARVGGRVEKLYFKYDYQYLPKGEKVLDLYSPELNTYQEEYLFLLESTTEQKLIDEGRNKLRLLGMTNAQIEDLEKKGVRTITVPVYTHYEGYILLNNEVNGSVMNKSAIQGVDMGNTNEGVTNQNENITSSSKERIREGMYVEKGQVLFSVNDFNSVWVILSLAPKYFSLINVGEKVTIKSELFPQAISGKVNYIEPIYSNEQKFLQVRVYLQNPDHKLKTNSLVTAWIKISGKKILTV
ncbi:MAG: efflux RND transporter periplasmic adaptor subunit, partial [Cytophagaceae bacterium]|nr:efflux RND transporter periplasmic adaptor subunit [Cytophagaceae bacterium]